LIVKAFSVVGIDGIDICEGGVMIDAYFYPAVVAVCNHRYHHILSLPLISILCAKSY